MNMKINRNAPPNAARQMTEKKKIVCSTLKLNTKWLIELSSCAMVCPFGGIDKQILMDFQFQ